jgi:superfamily II DNA or RNA helicase
MLTRQTVDLFLKEGVEFGVVACGFEEYENPDAALQICSLPTVYSRMERYNFRWPYSDLVIVDERHQQVERQAGSVFGRHMKEGAQIAGFTATPVGLEGHAQKLVNAGTYKEMLDVGAHLPVDHYMPDSPSLEKLRKSRITNPENIAYNRVPTIFGRVYEHWQKLNPDQLPAVGFAPGVEQAIWFTDLFRQKGVACCSLDAKNTVFVEKNSNGVLVKKEYTTDGSTRREVLEGSADGRYKIVWNRFILREAIDLPAWYHCILCTTMGSVSTYLQTTGRVLRNFPGYDRVILQDHSGNIDRHGYCNEERPWTLFSTNISLYANRAKKLKEEKDVVEIVCPKCFAYRTHGADCPKCGFRYLKNTRSVRMLNGTLKRVEVYKRKSERQRCEAILKSCLWTCARSNRTFQQAVIIAQSRAKKELIEWDNRVLAKYNTESIWTRKVAEVFPYMRKGTK